MSNQQRDPSDLLRAILADALRGTWSEMTNINDSCPEMNSKWATRVRDTWVRSLRAGFAMQYPDGPPESRRFAIFGGKPEPKADSKAVGQGFPSVVPGWKMREFLYDIAVVEIDHTQFPYKKGNVAFVKRAVWQVESEVARNGTEIAKDMSKLCVGAADHKLLVARQTTQTKQQGWLDFIGRVAKGMAGDFFLGLMPTYSSNCPDEARAWFDREVAITLYRFLGDGSAPHLVAEIRA